MIRWVLAAAAVVVFAAALTWLSSDFGYDREVAEMPVLALTALLVAAGLVFSGTIPRLVAQAPPELLASRAALSAMIAVGLAARLILFASTPALEDDYQRYLWDGAVTVSGLNPYAASPLHAQSAPPQSTLGALRVQSGAILDRVNHPQFATIYPPVSQAAFALANVLEPWSLNAWRTLVLVFDGVTLSCLLVLLQAAGRSQLWAAAYWWNPMALKEAFNSAHMDPLVVALVMVALVLAVKRRPVSATAMLAFAAGAKLWPVLLLPLILRPLVESPRKCAAAVVLFTGLMALFLLPIASAGFGDASGLRAYAETWQTNSALFPVLKGAISPVIVALGGSETAGALGVKAMLGLGIAAFALAIARQPLASASDLMLRAAVVIAALVLVSPAQYPWYVLWGLPFLGFWPSKAALALSALVPLYYASFHFAARETLETAGPYLVAAIWLPVWALLAYEINCWLRKWRQTGA